jgi:hypothetical protein
MSASEGARWVGVDAALIGDERAARRQSGSTGSW